MSDTLTFGFVMDPLDGVILDEDTTFAFMLAAQERGHDVSYIRPEDLYARNDEARATVYPAELRREAGNHYDLGEARRVSMADCWE